jgi:hypothetical protein
MVHGSAVQWFRKQIRVQGSGFRREENAFS